MAWIMGLGGPTLVALDQIDGVIDASRLAATDDLDATVSLTEVLGRGPPRITRGWRRGMTLISCLPDSWSRLEERGLKSFRHRLKPPIALQGMNDKVAAAALIRGRLAPAYRPPASCRRTRNGPSARRRSPPPPRPG